MKSLGATTVVDRNAPNPSAELAKAARGTPVDVVYDAISLKDTQNIGWDVLASGGTLVLVLPPLVDRAKYADKKIVDDVYANVHMPHLRQLGIRLYAALTKLVETGDIRVRFLASS